MRIVKVEIDMDRKCKGGGGKVELEGIKRIIGNFISIEEELRKGRVIEREMVEVVGKEMLV